MEQVYITLFIINKKYDKKQRELNYEFNGLKIKKENTKAMAILGSQSRSLEVYKYTFYTEDTFIYLGFNVN